MGPSPPSAPGTPAAIGVDVGGHGIRAVLVDKDGEVLASEDVALDGEGARTVAGVEARLAGVVGRLRALPEAAAEGNGRQGSRLPVGVGIPGFQDRALGVVRSSPNFPDWVDVKVGERLGSLLGVEVVVENDANCALLGEAWTGAARGVEDVVLLTLGTGIGTGFLVGGTLVRGARGAGAEGGHIVLHPVGRLCGCGKRGCLEAYASGPALVATAQELWEQTPGGRSSPPSTARELFGLLEQGSAPAAAVVERWADDLGRGIAALVHVFGPGAVVLAGGMTAHFDGFQRLLEDAVQRHAIPACLQGVLPLRKARLGPLAGAIGAAAAAL